MEFLVDRFSPKVRRYIYGAVTLAALVFGAWQAAGGDWKTAATSLLGSMVTALAHANTNPTDPQALPQVAPPAKPAEPQP